VTTNHQLEPSERRNTISKPITIKENAWIGVAATVTSGVTVGENSVVAAGAVVTDDVPPNTVVAGVPAKAVKDL
jgi:acetyltransferase-like isoleucine patch superfamily enzyme